MGVQKTNLRFPESIKYGSPNVRVVTTKCKAGCVNSDGKLVTRTPEALSRIVSRGSTYSYDVEVFVGLQRHLYRKQRKEIQYKLMTEHKISISTGQISILAKRFVDHFEALHFSRCKKLKEAMDNDGGYPLHIDATGEAGSGTLFVAYSGWRQWVLGAWRLTTECANQIKPCLEDVVKKFGAPRGIMRDLGRAMIPAVNCFVEQRSEKIAVLGCHSHFLKDIGKDLLDPAYSELRKLFRHYKIKPSLRELSRQWGQRLGPKAKLERKNIEEWAKGADKRRIPSKSTGLATLRSDAQWILDFLDDSGNLRFPFERPYLDFYKRCKMARRAMDAYLRNPPDDAYNLRSIKRLGKLVDPVVSDSKFSECAKIISRRSSLFNELRKTLRLKPGPHAPEVDMSRSVDERLSELKDIFKLLEEFKKSLLKRRPERGPGQDMREAIDLVLDHLDRHGNTLWGHVIVLPENLGGEIKIMDRTNNALEFFFCKLKQGERKRSGRKNLTQDMENLHPASALVQNLKHDDYVEIVCGSIDNLPEAFYNLDVQKRSEERNRNKSSIMMDERHDKVETASLSKNDKKFVRSSFVGKNIKFAASSRAPRVHLSHF